MKPLKILLFFAFYCQVSLAQTISAKPDTTQVGLVKSIPTITGMSQMNSDEMISISPGKSIIEKEKIDTVLKSDTTLKIDTVSVSEPASAPFAFADFSWLNGTSRKTSPPAFDSKYFTGDVTFDFNYSKSFNNPIDNTVVGSTALARNNELQLSFMGIGGDIHINNVRGRVMMEVPIRDNTIFRLFIATSVKHTQAITGMFGMVSTWMREYLCLISGFSPIIILKTGVTNLLTHPIIPPGSSMAFVCKLFHQIK
jgi:hypothetical protein